jgi:hypothetical protein
LLSSRSFIAGKEANNSKQSQGAEDLIIFPAEEERKRTRGL